MLCYRTFGCQVRQLDNGVVELKGLAAPYERYARVEDDSSRTGHRSWIREKIANGAFKRVVHETQAKRTNVFALINHKPNLKLTDTRSNNLQLKDTPKGLEVRMRLDPALFLPRALLRDIEAEQITGMSIGFRLNKFKKRLPAAETNSIIPNVGAGVYVESISADTRWRVIKDVDLQEVSVLTDSAAPAYADTFIKKANES